MSILRNSGPYTRTSWIWSFIRTWYLKLVKMSSFLPLSFSLAKSLLLSDLEKVSQFTGLKIWIFSAHSLSFSYKEWLFIFLFNTDLDISLADSLFSFAYAHASDSSLHQCHYFLPGLVFYLVPLHLVMEFIICPLNSLCPPLTSEVET